MLQLSRVSFFPLVNPSLCKTKDKGSGWTMVIIKSLWGEVLQ